MTEEDEVLQKLCGPTLAATMRWNALSNRELSKDEKVGKLMFDLYFSGRLGLAAAEYNLEKAGLIEMIQGHRAGRMLPNGRDNWWGDCRWTLTQTGKRVSTARLGHAMLRDPPEEIGEWDAEAEANHVAADCADCEVNDLWLAIYRRISVSLDDRAERIQRNSRRR
jgi:hypothetical protein